MAPGAGLALSPVAMAYPTPPTAIIRRVPATAAAIFSVVFMVNV
jgi:hypothetical protein